MVARVPERRRSVRLPASGRVTIFFTDPVPISMEAELVETSAAGFRVAHECRELVAGLEVRLQRDGLASRARVIWTHLLNGRRVSGCVLL
jgi:hypothetical protein